MIVRLTKSLETINAAIKVDYVNVIYHSSHRILARQ
ncbi:hypothetical protein X755_16055 [Mesorhizobium sp. LNJC405B00]|nr:hypothetical protein X768_32070 [Mesorhizobium sp. LSJC265A00]ESX98326.1 hypothetical protein X755_16055 [Mesorhizobium sp. LNJC405B00]ESZ40681.1 hypothetical protein X730_30135 [Mesorhizobium sp. L103C565B0]